MDFFIPKYQGLRESGLSPTPATFPSLSQLKEKNASMLVIWTDGLSGYPKRPKLVQLGALRGPSIYRLLDSSNNVTGYEDKVVINQAVQVCIQHIHLRFRNLSAWYVLYGMI